MMRPTVPGPAAAVHPAAGPAILILPGPVVVDNSEPAHWGTVRAAAGYLADNPPRPEEVDLWISGASWVMAQVRRHSAGGASL